MRGKVAAMLAAIMLLAACAGVGYEPAPQAYEADYYEPVYIEKEPQDPAPARGLIIGYDLYINDFLGLSFVLPGEDWEFVFDDEVAEIVGAGGARIAEQDEDFDIDGITGALYDMVAINRATGCTVAVMFEDISHIPGTGRYLDEFREQLAASGAFEFEFGQDDRVTLGGQRYDMLSASVEMGGASFRQHYLVRRQGDFMVVIIASLRGEAQIEQIIEQFG